MNTNDILNEIDAEISRLQQAKSILADTDTTIKRKPGRPAGAATAISATNKTAFSSPKGSARSKGRRPLSTEARAKIAAAQKARWAKTKKAAKKEARDAGAEPTAKTADPKGVRKKKTSAKKAVTVKKAARTKAERPATLAS
jgi:hypothetical protein